MTNNYIEKTLKEADEIAYDWFTPDDKSKPPRLVRIIDQRYVEDYKTLITQALQNKEKEVVERIEDKARVRAEDRLNTHDPQIWEKSISLDELVVILKEIKEVAQEKEVSNP